jgi:hypothetical protein
MVQPLWSRWTGIFRSNPPQDSPDPPPPETEAQRQALDAAVESIVHLHDVTAIAPFVPTSQGTAGIQERLDQFRIAMTLKLSTQEGPAYVPVPFGMSVRYKDQLPIVKQNKKALEQAQGATPLSPEALSRISRGRGAPVDIQLLTQALIDMGRLSSDRSKPLALRIRQMMFDHGIGIDCAGYTQSAYLTSTKTTRAAAGFDDDAREDLSALPARGFSRVSHVSLLRPGDIVSLGPPGKDEFGHRAIVYDQHEATDDELQDLVNQFDDAPAFIFNKRTTIYVVKVDSSWGSSGDPAFGGVERRTWWYNTVSREWAWTAPTASGDEIFLHGPQPYAHPLIGFFRGPNRKSTNPP